MRRILIATHGKMASGAKYTAELLLGQVADITVIDAYVNPEDNPEKQMEDFFRRTAGEQVVVLTDLQGGSVNQKLLKYTENPNVILITGFNLAILIQVMMAPEPITAEEISQYIEASRQELKLVSLALLKQSETGAADAQGQATKAENQTAKPKQAPSSNAAEKPPSSPVSSAARIAALRVDDRLIHGQVAMTWTKQLRVRGILVANDEAAADQTQKMALKMAAPAGIKVLVKPLKESIRVINHPKAANMRFLVLTRTIRDALAVRENTREIEFLNIGNVGRFDGIDASEKTVVTPTIMLTKDEIKSLKQLIRIDGNTCVQQVPNGERKPAAELLKNMGL